MNPDADISISHGAVVLGRDADTDIVNIEALYDLYSRGLFRYARALVNSAEDAEDAVQEVFVRIARNAEDLGSVGDMRRYLLKATRNAVYSILRGRRRRKRLVENAAEYLSSARNEPDSEAETILETFAALPPQQREVLALKVFQGLTFREIAGVIGKSQNTAASRYRLAIERLRAAAGEE